ncbi:HIT family protein [Microscilla marina]|uniref:HIT family protein n=1 Tax=Microscilla marina ATCC 23134 TaxID=313606 RepID=A1ZQE2_MICM2|nr:HIT family protein [Microscilla marina]EAY27314.1 HIT family protein [Microscilla marina ATCC 23134]
MSTIFSKIISGDIPSHKVAETEDYFAFLDIFPVAKGHTLVVPKKEVDYIYDLNDETLTGLHLFAKKIAVAVKKAFPCERVSVVVAGFEVPHAHIHLIPSNSMADLQFTDKLSFTPEELTEIVGHIQAHLD